MEITHAGKKWTVLKIYEKKQSEKDLLLCQNKYGIKECFQRCDFDCRYEPRKKKILTEEDIKKIEELVEQKTPRIEIHEIFKDYHSSKVQAVIQKARRKFGYTYREMYDDIFKGRAVIQYDLDGNILNRYNSTHEAARQTGFAQSTICNYCKKRTNGKKFIWRYEDDQFKREG